MTGKIWENNWNSRENNRRLSSLLPLPRETYLWKRKSGPAQVFLHRISENRCRIKLPLISRYLPMINKECVWLFMENMLYF
jgi:hypothetical protein